MVKRFISIFAKEISGLHEAAYLLGFFAITSQLLGLFRDRLLAHTFGADRALDLYYAAFRIPDLIFVTMASLVSASVLIPFLTERFKNSEGEGKYFISAIFSVFSIGMLSVSAIVYVLMPVLVPILFPGFVSIEAQSELIMLSRLLLLSPLFLGLSNFFGSITQLNNRFFIYALSPVIYNLGIVLGIVFLAPTFGTLGVALGVILGAFLHLAIQIPFIVSKGLFPRLIRPQFKLIRDVVLVSLPRTIALSSNELTEFFLISFASLMSAGSISVFNLSFNLATVPLSVIGVSYSLAAFPTLTKYFSSGNIEKYLEHLSVSLRHIIFLSVPVVVLFVVLRAQIVRVVLGSGQFNWSDTRLTAASLALFVISIIPQSLMLLFTRARYSAGKTNLPLVINISGAFFTIIISLLLGQLFILYPNLNLWLETLLRVDSLNGTSVLVLPFAFSIGATIAASLHIITFNREHKNFFTPVLKTFWQILFASVFMGFTAYLSLNILDNFFSLDTFFGIFMQGFIAGIIGIVVLIAILSLSKSRELVDMSRAFRKKIWKVEVVAPDAKVI